MIIGIIGAGASGMAAAITASNIDSNEVILFERQSRVGRKLQATGNGRCNLSNLDAVPEKYMGDEPHFSCYALEKYDTENTLCWFRSLGLFTVAEPGGRVYPYSDQANSVVDILRFALDKPNITVKLGYEVSRVRRSENGFCVDSGEETTFCDKLIIACGGLAGTKLGGSMSGYQLLRSFGHRSTRLRPSLVQLKSGWHGTVSLKGVRANCRATILKDGALFSQSVGELQFTEYGISGPVIFEISRDVCHGKGEWQCELDFMPDIPLSHLKAELWRRCEKKISTEELLTGILHNRLGRVLVKNAGISLNLESDILSEGDIDRICDQIKHLTIDLTEPMGMDSAQVTAGGVLTKDFDPMTMESVLVPGLYACGEVLDIDGPCGGYNLQWAWSSGRLAGLCAGGDRV